MTPRQDPVILEEVCIGRPQIAHAVREGPKFGGPRSLIFARPREVASQAEVIGSQGKYIRKPAMDMINIAKCILSAFLI